jgi:uncharacterized membrane protein HdeD (DUF308 family)
MSPTQEKKYPSDGFAFTRGISCSLGELRGILADYRRSHAHRFRGERDWVRLSILACILLTFSILAFANLLAPARFPNDAPGAPAMFSGAAILLFIAKIDRTELYADWMVSGALYVGVGYALLVGDTHGGTLAQNSFSILLIASGVVRIWLGMTVEPRPASVWLCSSGCIALVSGFATFGSWALKAPLSSKLLLSLDLLFLGICMAGFSHSLRSARRES